MQNHVRDQHVEAHVQYRCPLCDSILKSKNSFHVHLSSAHPEAKVLKSEQWAINKNSQVYMGHPQEL